MRDPDGERSARRRSAHRRRRDAPRRFGMGDGYLARCRTNKSRTNADGCRAVGAARDRANGVADPSASKNGRLACRVYGDLLRELAGCCNLSNKKGQKVFLFGRLSHPTAAIDEERLCAAHSICVRSASTPVIISSQSGPPSKLDALKRAMIGGSEWRAGMRASWKKGGSRFSIPRLEEASTR